MTTLLQGYANLLNLNEVFNRNKHHGGTQVGLRDQMRLAKHAESFIRLEPSWFCFVRFVREDSQVVEEALVCSQG